MRGFILLEVLVSIMISSMIFMSLMGAVFQLSKARVIVDDSIDVYSRVSTIMGLMEQDFGGATIPVQADLPNDKKQGEQPEPKKETPKEGGKKEEQPQEKTASSKEEKTQPIKNIFYSTLKNNDTHLVSCITNNPTAIYWSDRAGKAKARIARVVYTLVPDPARKESFLLKRQEGAQLELDLYTNPEKSVARAYEVAEGIKQFSVTYLYLEKKEEPQKAPAPADVKGAPKEAAPKKEEPVKKEPPQKPDYKTKPDWGVVDQKDAGEKKSKEPLMPLFMAVHLVLWNSTYKRDYVFDFIIELCAQEAEQVKQAQLRYVEDKKAAAGQQQPSQSSATPAAAQPVSAAPEKSAPEKELDLVAHNRPQQQPRERYTQAQEERKKEPIIVASEGNLPASFEEKLAEHIMQEFMKEMHAQELEKIEQSNDQDEQGQAQKTEKLSDESGYQEQIDMPAGRIDVVKEGDKTYVVYQGPLPLTQEMLEGIIS